MSLSSERSDIVYDSWLESRVAAFESALDHDPQASAEPFLAGCTGDEARQALAAELDRVRAERLAFSRRVAAGTNAHDAGVPERIGPFRLGRELGRGGFGRVFEARDERLERTVALKLMRVAFHRSGFEDSTFLAEARSVSRLRHPSIVVLFDVGEHAGLPYLVYERIDGSDLKALSRSGPMAVDDALRIAARVGQALAHAHDRGILHRDVKPSNILIDSSGEPFLTDFGLSGSLATGPGEGPGVVCGTPAYMAPEQARGEPATVSTDIYGLGAVLYECLTGQPPFAGPARLVREAVLAAMPEDPSDLRPGLRGGLDEVVLKALAKSPADRFADMREFVAAIQAQAGAEAASQGIGQRFARHPVSATLSIGAVCIALIGWANRPGAAGTQADVRTALSDSATLARERMERERDIRFREPAGVEANGHRTDFAAFYRTLLAVGEGLPKSVRAQFLLDCASACRNEGETGQAANDLLKAAALADSAGKEGSERAEATRVRLDIARAIAGWSELPGSNLRRRVAEATLAVELSQRLAEAGGSKPELAYDLITLGNLLRTEGEGDKAVAAFLRALSILEDLPAVAETTDQAVEHVRQQYLMAQALRGAGRKAEALAAYRLTGTTLAGLPQSIRTSERWLDIDADRCFHQARLLREAGDPLAARPLCERAIRQWLDLADRLKSAGGSQFELPLAHSRNAKGAILADLGEPDAAILSFEEAAVHYRQVLERDPQAINARRGLGNVLHTSARLIAEKGRNHDASVRFDEAVRQRTIIARDARGTATDRIDLAASLQASAQAQLATGEATGGLDALREAIAMFRELEIERPGDNALQRRLVEAARVLEAHTTADR